MELRHIRYFVGAAEALHFTHAAESLYISQPTLSTHIQQLEEEVGLPLFDRVGRNVRLTEAGKIFLEYSLLALRDLERAKEQIADLKGVVSGTLRIAALLGFGQSFLPSWIAAFHSKYPEIRFEVKAGTSDYVESELLSGNVDLGLSFMPPAAAEIDSELLFSEEPYLVVSEHHPLAARDQIEVDELSSIPLALVSRRFAVRALIDSVVAQKNISLNICVEIDDLQALLKMASAGDLCTILGPVGAGNYRNVRLVPVTGLPHMVFGILWQANVHVSPSARAFLEFIKEKCSAQPKLLQSNNWDNF